MCDSATCSSGILDVGLVLTTHMNQVLLCLSTIAFNLSLYAPIVHASSPTQQSLYYYFLIQPSLHSMDLHVSILFLQPQRKTSSQVAFHVQLCYMYIVLFVYLHCTLNYLALAFIHSQFPPFTHPSKLLTTCPNLI